MLLMGTSHGTTSSIAPLRTKSLDGKLYTRVAETTAKLEELLCLPLADQVARCEIDNVSDANFVPSECVVYLVRSFRGMPESPEFERLYKNLLLKRLVPRLPRAERGEAVKLKEQNIQDVVLGRFTEFLATDRASYDGRLDYFEIRFESAVVRLLDSAFKTEGRRTKRLEALTYDDGDIPQAVETAAAAGREEELPAFLDLSEDCRVKLEAAIDLLPQQEQTVIQMMRKGIPFTASDPSKASITKTLGKAERTVRYIRERALAALKNAMSEGGCL